MTRVVFLQNMKRKIML